MKFQLIGSLVALLGIASAAHADRGYGSRGGDRYSHQRVQASVRYNQGSRNYDHTYGRYGQATYGLRGNYDRDYGRRYSAGPRYYSGPPGYSGFSFGLGSSSYGDGVSFGFNYSRGSNYYGRPYYGSSYYGSRYYDRAYGPVIYAPPVYYAQPVIVAPPVVYSQPYYDSGRSYSYESGSYYGR